MNQIALDWTRDCSLPVSGRTQQARHASATGSQVAVRDRGALALAYRDLLIRVGPVSDDEAARVLGRLPRSMCSTRNGWADRVVPSGQYEVVEWPNGSISKRVKWQWNEGGK